MKNLKMISQMLGLVLFTLVACFAGVAYGGVNPLVTTSVVVGGAYILAKANMGVAFFMSMPDVSALAAYTGKYEKALFRKMVNGMDFLSATQLMLNVKTKLKLTKLVTTANVRPYSDTEEMQGTIAYTPRDLEISRGKAEFPLNPIKYRDTWMNEVLTGNIVAKDIPFEQFLFDSIFAEIAAEINDRTFYYGFDTADAVAFDAGDTYAVGDIITYAIAGVTHYYKCLTITTAGQDPEDTPAKWQIYDAEAFFPGLKGLIETEVTGGAITEVTTGSITSGATALAAFRELYRALSPAYKRMKQIIHCSYTDYEWLLDGVEDKLYQGSTQDASKGFTTLPGTDGMCIVKPATWLTTSRRLICTPKENILFGTNLLSDFNKIKIVESGLWTLKMGVTFEGGVQVRDTDAIVVGDQD